MLDLTGARARPGVAVQSTTCDPAPCTAELDRQAPDAVAQWAAATGADLRRAAAVAALAKADADPEAADLLTAELYALCGGPTGLVAALAGPVADCGADLDDRLVDWWAANLDRDDAARLRAKGRDPARWAEGGRRVLAAVARGLWQLRVAVQWARQSARVPALPRAVAVDRLHEAQTGRFSVHSDHAVRDGAGREVGRLAVATMSAATLAAFNRYGVELLGSVAGHRLLNLLVTRVHDQRLAKAPDWRAVQFEGGFAGLAATMPVRHNDNDRLRMLLHTGQCIHWTHNACTIGALWTWTHLRGNGARGPGRLRIVVGDALAPGLASAMRESGNNEPRAREARRLVPELRHPPPLEAMSERHRGPAWTLARLVVAAMVDDAERLAARGAVPIDLCQLADACGLPRDRVPRLLASWRSGDNDAPPLLVEYSGWFTLAEAHAAELAFIADGGAERIAGAEAGANGKRRQAWAK